MIVLDTSVVIDSFTGARHSAGALRKAVERGERLALPSLVMYEWLRGPRLPEELADVESLFSKESVLLFGSEEAAAAAGLYKRIRKARGREIDLAIAACAITREADLWTLNLDDFRDIPGLRVSSPA